MTIRLASFTLFLALTIGMPLAARSADEDHVGVPDGVSTEAWASIRSAYEAGRHAAIATNSGYEARNPGQALTTSFDHQGATMTADGGDWTWGLELTGWGFEGALQEVREAAELSATGARVTYRWSPGLSEWWINESRGFEHGFTAYERPDAANGNTGSPLQFALNVRGNLRAQISSDRRSVTFVDGNTGSARLQYAGLVAVDANGTSLEAWIEASGDGLVLSVCESAARYPLTIDPVVQQEAYIKASNTEALDLFGGSVAMSGDTLVVGTRLEDSDATGVNGNQINNNANSSGAVHVFVRTTAGWTQQAYIKASNTDALDLFGRAVAISGDTLVVAAVGEDSGATGVNGNQADNSAFDAGAAYVFVRSNGSWTQEAYLKASNTDPSDRFGDSVAISGDTIVVGTRWESSHATGMNGSQVSNSRPESGAAYVFVRGSGGWTQQAYVKASNTDAGDHFGRSVAISTDTLVVGAYYEASSATGVNGIQLNNTVSFAGAAYVFTRAGGGWTQEAYIKASNTDAFDRFGWSVAISGNTLVVGASGEGSAATGVNGNQGSNIAPSSGAAYVFVRSGGAWAQEAYVKASNTEFEDSFGYSVSISGDTLAVAAVAERSGATGVNGDQLDNNSTHAGAAYVFSRVGGTWMQNAYIKASNTNAGDVFGDSVAISGDSLVVGAPGEDSNATGVNGDQADNSAMGSGAAYVFELDLLLLGVNYCVSNANSTGRSGRISAHGRAAIADNNVELTASSLPNHSFGLFLTSQTQGFVTNPGGSAGNLCLGSGIGRYVGPGQIQTSGTAGEITLVLDLTSTPTPTGFVPVQPGETWNFQAWHRDAVGGVATSNFTDGVAVLFE